MSRQKRTDRIMTSLQLKCRLVVVVVVFLGSRSLTRDWTVLVTLFWTSGSAALSRSDLELASNDTADSANQVALAATASAAPIIQDSLMTLSSAWLALLSSPFTRSSCLWDSDDSSSSINNLCFSI